MRKSFLVVATTSSALAAALACGGSTSGNGGGGGNASNINAFASQFCALYQPCCADAGLPTNGQQCQALVVALGGASGMYDATAGNACLAALQQQSSQGTFCSSGGNAPECNTVFGGGSGSVPPGGQCMKNGDCSTAGGDSATCQYNTQFVDGGTTETRTCLLEKTGKAGDSPCIASIVELPGGTVETTFVYSGNTMPTTGYTCDAKNGVYCDSQTMACAAISDVGGPCQGSQGCKTDLYCDFSSMTCKATAPAGSSCAGNVQCDSMSYCDNTSSICKPALANGTACATSEQCQSRSCVNGKCDAGGNLGLQIICGQ